MHDCGAIFPCNHYGYLHIKPKSRFVTLQTRRTISSYKLTVLVSGSLKSYWRHLMKAESIRNSVTRKADECPCNKRFQVHEICACNYVCIRNSLCTKQERNDSFIFIKYLHFCKDFHIARFCLIFVHESTLTR